MPTYNFFRDELKDLLYDSDTKPLIEWLHGNGLLASVMFCDDGHIMQLIACKRRLDNYARYVYYSLYHNNIACECKCTLFSL